MFKANRHLNSARTHLRCMRTANRDGSVSSVLAFGDLVLRDCRRARWDTARLNAANRAKVEAQAVAIMNEAAALAREITDVIVACRESGLVA